MPQSECGTGYTGYRIFSDPSPGGSQDTGGAFRSRVQRPGVRHRSIGAGRIRPMWLRTDLAQVTPNDLSGNEHLMFFSHGERDVTQEGLKSSSAVLMPVGTVLFSSRAPIGYISIAENEVCSNQGFKSIVPNKGYGSYFVYYTVKTNTPAIAQQGVGTTFKEVSRDTMERFQIVLPPVDVATQFEDFLNASLEKRRILEHENRELTKLRDWLLPMLMNGQATVSD